MRFYTVTEAAEYLCVPLGTFRSWVFKQRRSKKLGEIQPDMTAGNRHLFSQTTLDTFKLALSQNGTQKS